MRYRDLPGFPRLFADFAEDSPASRPFLPAAPVAENLRAAALSCRIPVHERHKLCNLLSRDAQLFGYREPALANIERLGAPDSVCVVADAMPGLLGGTLDSWLKLLTAARLSEWLDGEGIPAVPIARLRRAGRFCGRPIRLFLGERALEFAPPVLENTDAVVPTELDEILSGIGASLTAQLGAPDLADALGAAYAPGTGLEEAWARLLARLLDFCGILFLTAQAQEDLTEDPAIAPESAGDALLRAFQEQDRRLRAAGYEPAGNDPASASAAGSGYAEEQSAQVTLFTRMPVAARIVDECEIYGCALAQAGFSPTLLWPRSSVTILSLRSRRRMERYGLTLPDVLAGPDALFDMLDRKRNGLQAAGLIDAAKDELERVVARLPAPEARLQRRIDSGKRRMHYQLEKLRQSFLHAATGRREIHRRHAVELCRELAPFGDLQERSVPGIQFFLRRGPDWPRALFARMDPWTHAHQLISLE